MLADKVEFNIISRSIHDWIREFQLKKFKMTKIQARVGQFGSWPIESRALLTLITRSSRGGGVRFDARGKATAVVKCLEDEFSPNETDVSFRSHYKQVRRGVILASASERQRTEKRHQESEAQ